ncbi:MAG: GIY-YIG nuclease family protein [Clostridia bacterium]|nr:GIY-YIG nuclease family protein [Clostridia bacterium]
MAEKYYVYILTTTHNKMFYIGVTNDLCRRTTEHRNKATDGFTKKYNVHKPVYFEAYSDPRIAIKREKQLKRWNRQKKIALIESQNPDWKDLSEYSFEIKQF